MKTFIGLTVDTEDANVVKGSWEFGIVPSPYIVVIRLGVLAQRNETPLSFYTERSLTPSEDF